MTRSIGPRDKRTRRPQDQGTETKIPSPPKHIHPETDFPLLPILENLSC